MKNLESSSNSFVGKISGLLELAEEYKTPYNEETLDPFPELSGRDFTTVGHETGEDVCISKLHAGLAPHQGCEHVFYAGVDAEEAKAKTRPYMYVRYLNVSKVFKDELGYPMVVLETQDGEVQIARVKEAASKTFSDVGVLKCKIVPDIENGFEFPMTLVLSEHSMQVNMSEVQYDRYVRCIINTMK